MTPRAKASIVDGLAQYMPRMVAQFGINTPLRQAHFLAQCGHESASFTTTVEFASGAAYEGRRDLGNTQAGDGRRFKGRGLIQLTGRANYKRYGDILGVDLVSSPDTAAQFPWAVLTAGQYWLDRSINALADRDDINGVTRKVNGGTNGLAHRQQLLAAAKRALQAGGPAPVSRSVGDVVASVRFATSSSSADWGIGVVIGVVGTLLVLGAFLGLLALVNKRKQARALAESTASADSESYTDYRHLASPARSKRNALSRSPNLTSRRSTHVQVE